MQQPTFYLAAPFFNPIQLSVVEKVETIFALTGISFISPRLYGTVKDTDPSAIISKNHEGLASASMMLAWLEYPLGEFERHADAIYPLKASVGYTDGFGHYLQQTVLHLPDTGVAFEMGNFVAQGKPVIGFHLNDFNQLNVMLSHTCAGIIKGFDHLTKWLQRGCVTSEVEPWRGNIT